MNTSTSMYVPCELLKMKQRNLKIVEQKTSIAGSRTFPLILLNIHNVLGTYDRVYFLSISCTSLQAALRQHVGRVAPSRAVRRPADRALAAADRPLHHWRSLRLYQRCEAYVFHDRPQRRYTMGEVIYPLISTDRSIIDADSAPSLTQSPPHHWRSLRSIVDAIKLYQRCEAYVFHAEPQRRYKMGEVSCHLWLAYY